ncbi:MAG TPA: tetratricopeptide repeat protein [Steroidobacteraceae bacterium]|nr:tetratricopeptide repeat protein [Steroidobacteraceae bacterium]
MSTRFMLGSKTAYARAGSAPRFAIVLIGLTVAASAVAADVPVRLSDLNATLNEIAPHARSYPPKFSSPEERVQAEEHLKALLAQLDKISDRYPDDEDILFIKGAANAMGHNLDYPGCADKAMAAFDRLLAIDQNNRRALYEYGGFLSGTTLMDKAIPYLDRAIQLGEERAHYTLAFVYVKKGDLQRALPEFEAYLKADPENATAKKFVTDIRSGKASVHVIRHEATESQ